MTQAKADQAWGLFQSLMRQYPLWPSTFSICECGRADARGSGKCALCIKEELAGIAGIFIVDRAEKAMKQVAEAWNEILLQAEAAPNLNFFECSACGGSDFTLFDDGDIQCSNVRCGCVMGGITVVEDDKL